MNEENRPPEAETDPAPLGAPDQKARRVVETLIFAADSPISPARIAQFAELTPKGIAEAVDELNREYEATGRTFRIHRVAQGYQFYTMPEFAGPVRAMYHRQFVQRLSKPALEVLAIVVYKQPVTRPEIEKLRGVDCSGPLLTLLERRLVATAGRARRPGSPFLYRTTREFLRYFGLESLEELPPLEEFGSLLAGGPEDGSSDEPEPHRAETLAIEYPPDRSGAAETGSPPEPGQS